MRAVTAIVGLVAIGVSAVSAWASGASPAVQLGPETVLAEPAGSYVGRLDLEPYQGPAGTLVSVTGSGLPVGEEFDVVWWTSKATWKVDNAEYHGREYAPIGYVIAKVKTDGAGSFTASFVAPEDFGFWHDVTVQQNERLFTQAAFYVEMEVEVSPTSGPIGTMISVDIKGIGRQQLQNSWLLLYDNRYTGWISSVTTGGRASFTIPATGKPGTHMLEVLHGDFTFPYRNMQQSPEPDRPRFAVPFEITEGDPVLPQATENQAQSVVRGLPAPGDFKVEPAFATVGQMITVSGEGFEPGKGYALHWSSVSGNRVSGSGWEEFERIIAEATADKSGKLEYRFSTPDDLGGAHRLRVEAAVRDKEGVLWIAPSALPLDVASGPAGTPFTIHLKGVGWTETANIYTVVYDNAYIGYACGFNSQGDVVLNLYATGEPGWHFIDLYPAIYKGKERRPNNFRLPQLTYADDHPGEDLPRFRFAFEVKEGR